MSDLTPATISKLKVAELKTELSARGLDIKGKKDDLVQRLLAHIEVSEETSIDDVESEQPQEKSSNEIAGTEPSEQINETEPVSNPEVVQEAPPNIEEETPQKVEEEPPHTVEEATPQVEEETSPQIEEESPMEVTGTESNEQKDTTVEQMAVEPAKEEETKAEAQTEVETKVEQEVAEKVEVEVMTKIGVEDAADAIKQHEEEGTVESIAVESVKAPKDDGKPAEVTPVAASIETTEEIGPTEDVVYECPAEFDERDDMRKMFCGGLDKSTTNEQFKDLFSKYGEIEDFIIIRKENQKSDRLFGFVTFKKCDDLEECLLDRPHKFMEKELDVKRAIPRGSHDMSVHYRVKKLHVANIPTDFTIEELKSYLCSRHSSKFGAIEDINFLKVKDEEGNLTDRNRGFGFVTVSSEDFADRIAIGEAKFILSGNSMRISKAKPRTPDVMRGGYAKAGYYWDGYGYGGGYGDYGYGGYSGHPAHGAYDYYGGGYGGYGTNYSAQKSSTGANRYKPY